MRSADVLYRERRRAIRGPVLVVIVSSGIIGGVVIAVVLSSVGFSPLFAYGLPAMMLLVDLLLVSFATYSVTVTGRDIRMGAGPVGRVLVTEIETHRQIDRSNMPIDDPYRSRPRVLGRGRSPGVRLTLRNGQDVIVESDKPAELEVAIAGAVNEARRRERYEPPPSEPRGTGGFDATPPS